jgi:hypothetical protein
MLLYFILIDQKKMLEIEGLEEVLRERDTYYRKIDKNFNFWITSYPLITNPSFKRQVKNTYYYNSKIKKLDLNKTAALISNNELFTVWLTNRIGEFENINLLNNISTSNSSGIYGKIELNLLENTFL